MSRGTGRTRERPSGTACGLRTGVGYRGAGIFQNCSDGTFRLMLSLRLADPPPANKACHGPWRPPVAGTPRRSGACCTRVHVVRRGAESLSRRHVFGSRAAPATQHVEAVVAGPCGAGLKLTAVVRRAVLLVNL